MNLTGAILESEALESLRRQLEQDQEKLYLFFQKREFKALAGSIGSFFIFVEPEGRVLNRQEGIERYFSHLAQGGGRTIQFEPSHVHVVEVEGKEHNYMAYIIWKFSYDEGKGDPVGSWAGVSRHRFNCQWETP